MDGREFYEKVAAHAGLEWLGSKLGASPALDRVFIGCHSTGGGTNGVRFELSPAVIMDTAWKELESVLTARRPPRVLGHLTRIVGYFSKVHNWNPSKQAELRARGRGDYRVPAVPTPRPAGLKGLTST